MCDFKNLSCVCAVVFMAYLFYRKSFEERLESSGDRTVIRDAGTVGNKEMTFKWKKVLHVLFMRGGQFKRKMGGRWEKLKQKEKIDAIYIYI